MLLLVLRQETCASGKFALHFLAGDICRKIRAALGAVSLTYIDQGDVGSQEIHMGRNEVASELSNGGAIVPLAKRQSKNCL